MSRRRFLSTAISRDSKVNRLALEAGDFAALVYTWLIPHAQDDASLTGTPEEILWAVMPGRRDKTAEDIARALEGMDRVGLIIWDKPGDTIYFPAESFYKYQTYIKPINRRQQEQRKTAENIAEHCESAENAASPSPSPSLSLSTTTATRTREEDLPPREERLDKPAAEPQPSSASEPEPDPIAEMDAASREDVLDAIQEQLGIMNPTVIYQLTGVLDRGATPGLLLWSIHEAVLNNVYRAGYVQSIVKRNMDEGHTTARLAQAAKERWEAQKAAKQAAGPRGRAAPPEVRGAPAPTNSGDEDPAIREYFRRWAESATTDEEMRALGLYGGAEGAAASGEIGDAGNHAPGGAVDRPAIGADAGPAGLRRGGQNIRDGPA